MGKTKIRRVVEAVGMTLVVATSAHANNCDAAMLNLQGALKAMSTWAHEAQDSSGEPNSLQRRIAVQQMTQRLSDVNATLGRARTACDENPVAMDVVRAIELKLQNLERVMVK